MGKKKIDYEYNPVKEQIGGKEAERVIWSTKSLDMAVAALNEGKPLKANPFIGSNAKLLKPDLLYKRTKEEVEEYIKCKNDPVYFASKCFLMTPEGLQPCKMRDYQVEYLQHLRNNRFSIMLSCRQAGKSVTTAIYCLWVILFNTDKTGLILSKSGPAGVDLLSKIKDMYLYLPYYLKCGTMKWNQTSISFDNNSSISTESFSPTAGLGKTINFLILDEFAWCPPNEVELFYNNIIPTVTTITDSNVCIMSTQNGFNLFCKIWQNAITKKSIYAPYKVDWWQVPNWNPKTKQWEKRTEAWRQMMIGILGSEEDFEYQYGTKFSASDKCLVSRETLTRVHDRVNMFVNKDLDISLIHKNNLLWKEDFDLTLLKTGYFIITIDLSEGGGSDSTVFTIFHVIDDNHMEQVGVYRSNKIDIESAALELWLLLPQLFAPEHYIFSIEWNTYGALFYQLLLNLNETDYREDWNWRFNIHMELDMTAIVRYKKGNDDTGDNNSFNINQTIPGIRWNSSNKIKACALLRMEIEKNYVTIYDLETATELENFEDKNGNGSYKASYGHDDNIMTFCQIPLLKKTPKFKNLIEDINDNTMSQQISGGFTSFYQY